MSIRVLLVDDHKIVIEGLRSLLEKEPDVEVVAEAENGRESIRLARKLLPDVVLMDVAMPEMNGVDATRRIVGDIPGIKILALSMHSDKRFVVEALNAGAKGYLLKECAAEELIEAIRTVVTDEIYICKKISGVIVKEYIKQLPAPHSPSSPTLTSREREILQLIAEGKSTKEIAFTMMVCISTVETFRRLIMKKLNVFSVAGLTKYAIREGLTSIE
ncbi:MAG: LuxR family transcriptional [Geobacteraceae bacterium]|nr:MAG: LuxR family transcriptional [Geobacteraceae bacterium]